jgi:hypothetical protein
LPLVLRPFEEEGNEIEDPSISEPKVIEAIITTSKIVLIIRDTK